MFYVETSAGYNFKYVTRGASDLPTGGPAWRGCRYGTEQLEFKISDDQLINCFEIMRSAIYFP
jgi:hypothetical protein